MHTSRCWSPLLPQLDLPAVAVDLPGRGRRPADLADVTVDDCVQAVLDDADEAGFERFVLVGHSMGGVTITETALLHADRVAALVYVAAMVPRPGPDPDLLRGEAPPPEVVLAVPPNDVTRAMFGNDLTDEQWSTHRAQLVPESRNLLLDPVHGDAAALPATVPTAYVMLSRDTVGTVDRVTEMCERLGPAVVVRTIAAGHSVMVSQPAALAQVIAEFVVAA
jgi:pimeloyl-ACP methyl ester carboxylesterase